MNKSVVEYGLGCSLLVFNASIYNRFVVSLVHVDCLDDTTYACDTFSVPGDIQRLACVNICCEVVTNTVTSMLTTPGPHQAQL